MKKVILLMVLLVAASNTGYAGIFGRLMEKAERLIGLMDYECKNTKSEKEKVLLHIDYNNKYVTINRGTSIPFTVVKNVIEFMDFPSRPWTFDQATKTLTYHGWQFNKVYFCTRDIF